MVQIRPDELIRILLGELQALGAGLALLGYDENGLFAGNQAVAGANSIGMGDTTTVTGDYAVVGGGRYNSIGANADYCVVGGGHTNTILGTYNFIGGGISNDISAWTCAIGGGDNNSIIGGSYYSVIGGGHDNIINTIHVANVIGGGFTNSITGANTDYAVIGGGYYNSIDGQDGNTIAGGGYNVISAATRSNFIGGGYYNQILDGLSNVIVGGDENVIPVTALGGPQGNAIGGGAYNTVSSAIRVVNFAVIPGGLQANASIPYQIVSAAGALANVGDAQGTIQLVCARSVATHTLNVWWPIGVGGIANTIVIPASSAWTVHCLIVGITQNAAQQWSYELIGMIERDNANNTTLAGQTLRVIFESDANYNAQLAADDANECLEVEVRRTGGADYNVRWVATLRMAEVTYP